MGLATAGGADDREAVRAGRTERKAAARVLKAQRNRLRQLRRQTSIQHFKGGLVIRTVVVPPALLAAPAAARARPPPLDSAGERDDDEVRTRIERLAAADSAASGADADAGADGAAGGSGDGGATNAEGYVAADAEEAEDDDGVRVVEHRVRVPDLRHVQWFWARPRLRALGTAVFEVGCVCARARARVANDRRDAARETPPPPPSRGSPFFLLSPQIDNTGNVSSSGTGRSRDRATREREPFHPPRLPLC